ncbi:MAG: hypothetical protein Q9191_002197 [Dirinaria sp. TL-2023a]
MSGIPVYTQSPTSAAKADGITPKTASVPTPTTSTHASTTSVATSSSTPARPEANIAPNPTQYSATPAENSPPPPQPGAVPLSSTSTNARRPSIPPPPKAGEKPLPREYYAKPTATPSKPQPYPPQMSVPSPDSSSNGVPPSSVTSTTQPPLKAQQVSSPYPTQPAAAPSAARSRANTLEHPPGYAQDPHAQEMTPDARFATEQQATNQSSSHSPVLPGYNGHSGGANKGFEEEQGIWDMAKKLVSQAGEKVVEFEEEVWRKLGEKK